MKEDVFGIATPTGDRVLLKPVYESSGPIALLSKSPQMLSHYVVLRKGPKCSDDLNVGDCCMHISVDGASPHGYVIVREEDIVLRWAPRTPEEQGE